MGDNTEALLFVRSLLNDLLSFHKFTKWDLTFSLWLFLSNLDHTLYHFLLSRECLCLSKFWNETFGLLNRLSKRCLDLVTANNMGDNTEALLFIRSLSNDLLCSREFTKWNLAFCLWLFLSYCNHTLYHFLLSSQCLCLSELWYETFGLLNRLSKRRLDFVTANKMGDNTDTLLFIRSLSNDFLCGHEFTKWNLAFCFWLFLSDFDHTLDHFLFTGDCLCLSEFWNETFGLLNRLSKRTLDLVTANKMSNNAEVLLFIQGLFDSRLRRHKFT